MNRTPAFCALLALLAAPAASQAPPTWPVTAKPTLTIGVEEGEPEYEFSGVTSARRLGNGMVVVANTRPLELRLFDAKGKFVRRIGRSGNGPGEFRGDLFLVPTGGDSIVVFVNGRLRNIAFALDGTLLGETVFERNLTPMLATSAMSHRTYIRSGGATMTGCVRPVLAALPMEKEPKLRDLYADIAGRSWVRDFGTSQFTIFAPSGRSVARVMLPAGFEPTQIATDFILGVGRLQDDVEQVQLWGLTSFPPGTRAPCLGQTDSFPVPTRDVRLAEMRTLLRNAATSLEASYARSKVYPKTAEALDLDVPSDMLFTILRSTGNGWAVGVFDRKAPYVCTMSIGDGTPPGWTDGLIRCGG